MTAYNAGYEQLPFPCTNEYELCTWFEGLRDGLQAERFVREQAKRERDINVN